MNDSALKTAKLLHGSGLTLSVAESCSGGLLSKRITDIPGSSEYFLLGVVTYANSAKVKVLAVPEELIEKHGAVSCEVALAMAAGVRKVSGSDIALATTGIAGPDGGTPDKPVGTVFIALADSGGCMVSCHHFGGSREMVREAAVAAAMEILENRLSVRADSERE